MGSPLHGGCTGKKNIFVPSVSGGLRDSCCGECHKVKVRTGTKCRGVRMYLDTTACSIINVALNDYKCAAIRNVKIIDSTIRKRVFLKIETEVLSQSVQYFA